MQNLDHNIGFWERRQFCHNFAVQLLRSNVDRLSKCRHHLMPERCTILVHVSKGNRGNKQTNKNVDIQNVQNQNVQIQKYGHCLLTLAYLSSNKLTIIAKSLLGNSLREKILVSIFLKFLYFSRQMFTARKQQILFSLILLPTNCPLWFYGFKFSVVSNFGFTSTYLHMSMFKILVPVIWAIFSRKVYLIPQSDCPSLVILFTKTKQK
jgi:hypothetical protein